MSTAPTSYTIRVNGLLDDHWSTWLDGAVLRRSEDGTTALTLSDVDQARLHGVLSRLRDVGVELLELRAASVTRAPSGRAVPSTTDTCQAASTASEVQGDGASTGTTASASTDATRGLTPGSRARAARRRA